MTTAVAARSVLRTARIGAARFSGGLNPRAAPSPFRIPTQKLPSHPILRSPVETSFVVESLLPFHTATASALLTSMLSVAPRTFGWTREGVIIATMMYDEVKEFRQSYRWMIIYVLGCGAFDHSS